MPPSCLYRLRCECMVCCKITRREERPGKGDVECTQEQSKSRKNSYLTYILIVPAAIVWLSCDPDQRDRSARIECSCARATCDQKGLHCLRCGCKICLRKQNACCIQGANRCGGAGSHCGFTRLTEGSKVCFVAQRYEFPELNDAYSVLGIIDERLWGHLLLT